MVSSFKDSKKGMQGEGETDFTFKTIRMDQRPSTKRLPGGSRATSPAVASSLLHSSCLDVKEMPRHQQVATHFPQSFQFKGLG